MSIAARLGLLAACLLPAPAVAAPADGLALLPGSAALDGPKASQRFLVEHLDASGLLSGEATAGATFSISNPNIAAVSPEGVVTPVSDGVATLTAAVGGRTATALVRVRDADRDEPRSFRNHVLPVMTRFGCNQGSCHGAAAGKNGFRLTLRGYGPELDYDALTRQAAARRIDKTSPAESLMLLKATGAVEHGGGPLFAPGSADYRVIAEWIGAGLPAPTEDDPRIDAVEAFPPAVSLRPGDTQQILVRASYTDGRTADVTRWAKFGTTDETVATVDDSGRLTVVGPGEGAVTVWFDSRVALSSVTVPHDRSIDETIFAEAPRHNRVDELNLDTLAALRIPPSPPCDDATFLRRAYVDATGTLPAAEEVDAFLADDDPDKRAKLVDRLIGSEAFVDYWAYKWSDLLLVSSRNLPAPAMWSFYRFIRRSVAENRPWDDFARDVLTAKGSTLDDGAGNYFVIHRDPIELTENASMAFLGLAMTCARCHNHPLEKWTQDQYYGFANLFGRVKLKDGDLGAAVGDVEVIPASSGDIPHPRRGDPMAPQPLDAEPVPLDAPGDRREALADWLESPDNPYFAPALVNRVWANFFSRGLVDPEDDLRATNPPSDRALMDWLVADFRSHDYDVRHLIRTIMTSASYQRSSAPVPGNEGDTKFLSRYVPRRLPAEVLLDAMSWVAEVPTAFPGYPAGWRSLQLPDAQVANPFLDSFGRPARNDTCSCERSDEPSLAQALHLANGDTLNEKLRHDNSAPARLAASNAPFSEVLDLLFKSALSRAPTDDERSRILPMLESALADAETDEDRAAARRRAIEDLYWATLTGNEFLFNH
ncbi:DUF1553 domain-containing protein [Tautonia plasticadhaerens]|uniref:Bacterial Ig-like domain (Group 2) n=1 Tax=Tautonia plasticadhaerens TaxID=2527974 RepID=A0A518H5L2_9BACT|nr:DUF1553 domain-containing protein [Tautonia plasticadhaerens]QDV36131.1 Bacterial Ig-like domain (group 2) [Tautonia plasticadhaerens]